MPQESHGATAGLKVIEGISKYRVPAPEFHISNVRSAGTVATGVPTDIVSKLVDIFGGKTVRVTLMVLGEFVAVASVMVIVAV